MRIAVPFHLTAENCIYFSSHMVLIEVAMSLDSLVWCNGKWWNEVLKKSGKGVEFNGLRSVCTLRTMLLSPYLSIYPSTVVACVLQSFASTIYILLLAEHHLLSPWRWTTVFFHRWITSLHSYYLCFLKKKKKSRCLFHLLVFCSCHALRETSWCQFWDLVWIMLTFCLGSARHCIFRY